jgi:hypothetical protein
MTCYRSGQEANWLDTGSWDEAFAGFLVQKKFYGGADKVSRTYCNNEIGHERKKYLE